MSLGEQSWSVRRLAAQSGIPETSCRRIIAELEMEQIVLTEWPLDRAIMGAKAYRDGHSKKAIGVLGATPFVGSSSWLVSNADGDAHMFSTLLQATAFIESHPSSTYHLSPIGTMGLEVAAA